MSIPESDFYGQQEVGYKLWVDQLDKIVGLGIIRGINQVKLLELIIFRWDQVGKFHIVNYIDSEVCSTKFFFVIFSSKFNFSFFCRDLTKYPNFVIVYRETRKLYFL